MKSVRSLKAEERERQGGRGAEAGVLLSMMLCGVVFELGATVMSGRWPSDSVLTRRVHSDSGSSRTTPQDMRESSLGPTSSTRRNAGNVGWRLEPSMNLGRRVEMVCAPSRDGAISIQGPLQVHLGRVVMPPARPLAGEDGPGQYWMQARLARRDWL